MYVDRLISDPREPRTLPTNNPVLRKLESFGSLSDDDRTLVNRLLASERSVRARTSIIREGARPSGVHLITSGFACRYKTLMNGRRQIVALLLPGDFCDLNAFIVEAMDHSIATLAPSRIVEASQEAIFEMLKSPSLSRAMFMSALVDSATLREWIANIGSRRADDRIAHLVCEIYARLHAVGLASDDAVVFPMNQTELSECVGLSLVHTNKSLRILRDRNLLSYSTERLLIQDPDGLRNSCGFTPNYLHLNKVERPLLEIPRNHEPAEEPYSR